MIFCRSACLALAAAWLAGPATAADPPSAATPPSSSSPAPKAVPVGAEPAPEAPAGPIKIRPKDATPASSEGAGAASLLAPDINVIDTPTTAVLDYGGYSANSRFYRNGGLLQYVSFGVYEGINLGGSLSIDNLVGDNRTVRVRAPNIQVKWRFYDGDRSIPSFALGFDGQGFDYNQVDHRYNHRQRGFFIVASQELGLPGLMAHPSMNISDFDTNHFFGALPISYNIQDKVSLLAEWDNISNFSDSRFNSGVRIYVTPHFDIDFAVRAIGQGGYFPNGDSRGPERIVQLRYTGSF